MDIRYNDIEEIYCSIEVCKSLKTIGFDVYCEGTFTEYHRTTEYNKKGIKFEKSGILHGRNSNHESNKNYTIYAAPTQRVAIEWIRENFNIHIEDHMDIPTSGKFDGFYVWTGVIKTNVDYKLAILHKTRLQPSAEEAINKSIIYTLTKLIK